jgi:hypothetical protein
MVSSEGMHLLLLESLIAMRAFSTCGSGEPTASRKAVVKGTNCLAVLHHRKDR